jgi:hypothetical protein
MVMPKPKKQNGPGLQYRRKKLRCLNSWDWSNGENIRMINTDNSFPSVD